METNGTIEQMVELKKSLEKTCDFVCSLPQGETQWNLKIMVLDPKSDQEMVDQIIKDSALDFSQSPEAIAVNNVAELANLQAELAASKAREASLVERIEAAAKAEPKANKSKKK